MRSLPGVFLFSAAAFEVDDVFASVAAFEVDAASAEAGIPAFSLPIPAFDVFFISVSAIVPVPDFAAAASAFPALQLLLRRC